MTNNRVEIRFAGFGGQGVALMGRLLGETVSLYSGRTAIMTQSYGPESRGGASSCDVVIDDGEIDFPKASKYDYFIVMSEEAYTKYVPNMKDGAVMFVEENLVILDDHAKRASKIFKIPATEYAESLGSKLYANICMLGFICANSDLFKEKDFMKVMKEKVKERFIKNNIAAFNLGKDHKG
jgi:2-oxoglutarate ferredoxin oxidoreductase subunit gamma